MKPENVVSAFKKQGKYFFNNSPGLKLMKFVYGTNKVEEATSL